MHSGGNKEYSNHLGDFDFVQHFFYSDGVLDDITTKPQAGPGGAAWAKAGHIFFSARSTSVVYVH